MWKSLANYSKIRSRIHLHGGVVVTRIYDILFDCCSDIQAVQGQDMGHLR
jgi:hypothetical protein